MKILIFRFNEIPIKIPVCIFVEIKYIFVNAKEFEKSCLYCRKLAKLENLCCQFTK